VSTYVAKGLWRNQITYAKTMMETIVRIEAITMLTWYLGLRTGYRVNVGVHGKYFQRLMTPDLWARWQATYADADPDRTWAALSALGAIFREVAQAVAHDVGVVYPRQDDERVSHYLRRARNRVEG
jgi:aminoglycoside 6-adenylyltransferase